MPLGVKFSLIAAPHTSSGRLFWLLEFGFWAWGFRFCNFRFQKFRGFRFCNFRFQKFLRGGIAKTLHNHPHPPMAAKTGAGTVPAIARTVPRTKIPGWHDYCIGQEPCHMQELCQLQYSTIPICYAKLLG